MSIACVGIRHIGETYQVVNWNYTVTSFPVVGLDPDLEVLVKRTPYEMPDYDPRLFDLITNSQPSDEGVFDSEYPTQRMWVTTYSLQEVSTEQKQTAVDEAEQLANLNQIPTTTILKYMAIGVAIADRRAQGLTVTAAMETFMDAFHTKAQKIWTNNIIAAQKKAELLAAGEVDLDAGWEE